MLLASVKEHKNVSLEFPIARFLNDKSFKEHLVREALPTIDNVGGFELCGKGTCQMCGYIIRNNNFTTKACRELFEIQSGLLNCKSENVL